MECTLQRVTEKSQFLKLNKNEKKILEFKSFLGLRIGKYFT